MDKPRRKGPAGKGGPASPSRRPPGDVDEKILARLADEGMLSPSGRRRLERGKAGPSGDGAKKAAPAVRSKQPVKRAPVRAPRREEAVPQRLQKVMAQAGVASRRHSEDLIQAGRVTVNGRVVTELGTKVTPGRDLVEVDGRALGRPERLVYILLNKPKGYVTTLYDPQGRPMVTDLLGADVGQRVYPVGRLDFETEGLLLLTNDGELANALMHPARQVKKTYVARVRGVPNPTKLQELERGIQLDDGPTAPAEAKLLDVLGPNGAVVSLRIHEGRNRQVRRMFAAIGHEVISLRRTTLGPLNLHRVALGEWRELTTREVTDLRQSVALKPSRGYEGPAKGAKPERLAPAGEAAAGPRPAKPGRFARVRGEAAPVGGGPKPAGGGKPAVRGRGPGGPKPAGGGKPAVGGRAPGGPKSARGPKPAGGGRGPGGGGKARARAPRRNPRP